MLAVYIILTILFIAGLCFFLKASHPTTFDQMEESEEPQPTEYFDYVKMVPKEDREPTIRKTISV